MWAVCGPDQAETLLHFRSAICTLGRISALHLHCPEGGFADSPPPKASAVGVVDHSICLHLSVQVMQSKIFLSKVRMLLYIHTADVSFFLCQCRMVLMLTNRELFSLSAEKSWLPNSSKHSLGHMCPTTQKKCLIKSEKRRRIRWVQRIMGFTSQNLYRPSYTMKPIVGPFLFCIVILFCYYNDANNYILF